jgi:hypothetical protein
MTPAELEQVRTIFREELQRIFYGAAPTESRFGPEYATELAKSKAELAAKRAAREANPAAYQRKPRENTKTPRSATLDQQTTSR